MALTVEFVGSLAERNDKKLFTNNEFDHHTKIYI